MEDNNNELHPAENTSSGSMNRAERIRAIKNSIHADSAETPAAAAQGGESDEWEKEIAERIARRVKEVKDSKDSAANQNEAASGVNQHDDSEADNSDAADSTADKADKPEEVSETKDSGNEPEIAAEPEDEQKAPEKISDESAAAENPAAAPIKKKKKKKKKKSLGQSLYDLLPQKKDKISERIRKIVFLGSCVTIVVCGTMVVSYYIDTISTQNDYDDIENVYINFNETTEAEEDEQTEEEVYTLFPWAEQLLQQNEDLVGYLTIPGDKDNPDAENEIAYPVVQSDDLEKYLNTSFNGEEARAGALFLDYRDSFDNVADGILLQKNSDNLIVYGHNMKDENMFGKLKYYRSDPNYYTEHPIINFDSKYKQYQFKIFAIFIVDAEDQTETAFDCWNYINFNDEDDFYDYVNEAKRRTIWLNDVDVKYGDQLLTLSTCNTIFGSDGPGRLIVMARKVRDGEDPYEGTENITENPNIKWPSLYYESNSDEKYDPDAEFIPYG